MSQRPARICKRPGCPGLVREGVCDTCGPAKRARDNRPSYRKRGYTSQWDDLRRAYIKHHPLCEECKRQGRIRPAEIVHHIARVSAGGPVITDQLMSVCRQCHGMVEKQRPITKGKGDCSGDKYPP